MKHVPVLKEEVLEAISPKEDGIYFDGTLGYGGHAEAVLQAVSGKATYIGCDRDEDAIEFSQSRLADFPDVRIHHSSYLEIDQVLENEGIELVDGILLDLGASSPQFDSPERGFSFRFDGPLDMRFDSSSTGPTAADVLNTYSQDELMRIFKEYGEERHSKRIAKAIVLRRKDQPFTRTIELVDLIESIPHGYTKIHPATRVFQALRIEVNHELDAVKEIITKAVNHLKPGGRLAIISFHSLEDRIVKEAFKYEAKDCICPKEFPICKCDKESRLRILTKKPLTETKTKIQTNPRARSAKLRIAERISYEKNN